MNVHLNAFFILDFCPSFSLAQLAQVFAKPTEFKYGGRHRVLGMAVREEYVVGLLASATNQSRDPLLRKNAQGKLEITVLDTSDRGERQSLNFFAINSDTGVGLVSRNSGSVVSFGTILRSRYLIGKRVFREASIAAKLKAGESFSHSAIVKQFALGKFDFKPLYRKGTFESLLGRLDVITELSYDEPDVKDAKYTLVRDQLRLDHRQLKFETAGRKKGQHPKNRDRNAIVDFIKNKILGRHVRVATAKGKNTHGIDMPPVTISPEVDSYGSYPYNDVVIKANVAIDDIANVPMIAAMIGVARSQPAIFETPVTE